MRDLPYSEACERNKRPIFEALRNELTEPGVVLEIGSGTGQHAQFLAAHLPHLRWQPTEVAENIAVLEQCLALGGTENLLPPYALDVGDEQWSQNLVNAVFSANTLHIMSWASVQSFFRGVGRTLAKRGTVCVYGPFRYGGRHTSASNESFDAMLRARDARSGVRDFEALDELARAADLYLQADHALPANNHLLVWRTDSK